MKLIDYINKYHDGNQAAFARSEGVFPTQVSQWLAKDFIVIEDVMYSYKFDEWDSLVRDGKVYERRRNLKQENKMKIHAFNLIARALSGYSQNSLGRAHIDGLPYGLPKSHKPSGAAAAKRAKAKRRNIRKH